MAGPELETQQVPNLPALSRFTDLGPLLLRLMVGLVFATSRYRHRKNPDERSKSIGMSKGFRVFLGIAEVASWPGRRRSHSVGRVRIDPHYAGAIGNEIFVWLTGFWGEKASGRHCDPLFTVMNLVIAFTNGGACVPVK
jgi:putative oxidoreductase